MLYRHRLLSRSSQGGWSLLELLLAASTGLILCAGVLQLYFFNHQAFAMVAQAARVQENGRAALQMLQQDVRSAGFIGCLRLPEALPGDDQDLSPATSLRGYVASAATQLPSTVKIGTDVLYSQKADPPVLDITKASAASIHLRTWPKGQFVRAGELWVISDCMHAELFRPGGFDAERHLLIPAQPLQFRYGSTAQAARLAQVWYFIAGTGRKRKNGEPITALYRLDANAPRTTPTEAVEGVSDMRIRYGYRALGTDRSQYYPAASITDWAKVQSVAIQLLIESPEPVHTVPVPVSFAGETHTSRALAQVWSTTIALRERLP